MLLAVFIPKHLPIVESSTGQGPAKTDRGRVVRRIQLLDGTLQARRSPTSDFFWPALCERAHCKREYAYGVKTRKRVRYFPTQPHWLDPMYMKTLTNIGPRSDHEEHFAVPRNPKLVGQWQRGIETMSGQVQWKLHLTLAHSSSPALTTVNHYKQT